VDEATIDRQVLGQGHFWMNLRPAGVETFEMNRIAGFDDQPWLKRAIPAGMRGPGRKIMFGHGLLNFHRHLDLDQGISRQRTDANGSSNMPGRFPQ
jgi:hypothetical protein